MTTIQTIESALTRMSFLFRQGSDDNWANAIDALHKEITEEPSLTARKILSMYGGMGSLNDIILYKNGQPLIDENNELDSLKSKLYELCKEMIRI